MTNPGRLLDAPPSTDEGAQRRAALIQRRAELLGPSYRLFYERPVEFVSGHGAYLFDRDGAEYLDAYNNVPSVGHAHPRVAAAIAQQAATLTTHTRYLDERLLDYAERLIGTLPSAIERVTLTCTGSDAMDLALRIVRAATSGTGIIVTANAYHGVTALVSSFSPSLGDGVALGEHVRTVPAPDPRNEDPGAVFAADVRAAIDDLERHGITFGALVLDSVFSSDGVVPDPAGFLAPAREVVRAAGGLYVADEVQAGFARTGRTFWGHLRHGIEPDLVVMGKAMGNGHPVAAVAMTRALSDVFGTGSRYFNTFGGNTVSVAAATAVLDVIADEQLAENSHRTGAYLLAELRRLAQDSSILGDIRGAGLFLGVDVTDEQGRADPAAATAIVNEMRDRRVLISTTGATGATLKIRPPLVFDSADANRLLAELAATVHPLG